jgi:4a-hydroxytetrahydrobiopterin dehydratase
LAAKIEEVVQWQPAKAASEKGLVSALEGTPNEDPRFKYIKYDD